jgi:hypothetical protein
VGVIQGLLENDWCCTRGLRWRIVLKTVPKSALRCCFLPTAAAPMRTRAKSSQSLRIIVPMDEAVPLQPAVAAAALAMSANERVVKRR